MRNLFLNVLNFSIEHQNVHCVQLDNFNLSRNKMLQVSIRNIFLKNLENVLMII